LGRIISILSTFFFMWIIWEGLSNSRSQVLRNFVSTRMEWINNRPVEEHTFNQRTLILQGIYK
jgi:hypothetical protein